jgi:hypothetical protein
VTQQFLEFCEAIHALLPVFERAGIPWVDNDRYHDVDQIFETLFSSMVMEFAANESHIIDDLKGYKFGVYPYESSSKMFLAAYKDNDYVGKIIDISLDNIENNNSIIVESKKHFLNIQISNINEYEIFFVK